MTGPQQRETVFSVSLEHEIAKASILRVLAYFDIFHYPISRHQVKQFIDKAFTDDELDICLARLVMDGTVFIHSGFYSLQDNPLLIHRRLMGNERAAILLQKAHGIGRFLFSFPFVRAIGISGSLSKDFADENADIDFFIITRANRLWIARTLMHLFKKFTFLTGNQHYYCMNYYLDGEALVLKEQNIFTAMELKTLLPVCGEKTMEDFFLANRWCDDFLPSCDRRHPAKSDPPILFFKRFIEMLFVPGLSDSLDSYLHKITRRRWEKKEHNGKQNKKGFIMGLDTGKHFARSNPESFQEKVLSLYQQKITKLEAL